MRRTRRNDPLTSPEGTEEGCRVEGERGHSLPMGKEEAGEASRQG